jgi:hypothetical protein
MSQRNRMGLVAMILAAAVAVSAPAFAAGPEAATHSQAGVWEQAWSWLASLVDPGPGLPRRLAGRWEKEGGAIDPNGTNPAALRVPATPIRTTGGQ